MIDREKLNLALEGDSGALNVLVAELTPHVERQLPRYPVSDDDRLDLVQSTLLQVVRRIRSFRGDSSFTTWLFRVTANEALMLMRSQRRQRARLVEGLDLEDLSPRCRRADDPPRTTPRPGRARGPRPPRPRRAARGLPRRGARPLPRRPRAPRDRREVHGERERRPLAPPPRRVRLRAILDGTALAAEAREEALLSRRSAAWGPAVEHAA